jgi:hypothetical protein
MVYSEVGFWSKFFMPIASFIFAMALALSLGGSSSPEEDYGDIKRKGAHKQ